MIRSFRKTPICGIAVCASEKRDKQLWHRAFRRAWRAQPDIPSDVRLFSDPWTMGKDGKGYWPDMPASRRRK